MTDRGNGVAPALDGGPDSTEILEGQFTSLPPQVTFTAPRYEAPEVALGKFTWAVQFASRNRTREKLVKMAVTGLGSLLYL